ncbi:hypothetical protein MIND_00097000 [Mycena indigotica]|uniref:Uncharacterized protein n=1 Tax=Mycena indigotica TaxID=2126181 RepID=A0A8H6WEK7_9AGAR|nr:uncharacterized protein MIND_00097000 [Mycena indigotica]KAF7315809.1 hypothetical protein MIND_00097000 [Mycena indigotica]
MSARSAARSKPLPKSYTEQQLVFLRSHLAEYERRSHGPVRGDAKKFALERAAEFIVRFGLPENVDVSHDTDARYKEQLYCWYKNTSGRNRRKADGKPKSSGRKDTTEQAQWEQFSEPSSSSSPTITFTDTTPANSSNARAHYNNPSSTLANALQPSPSPPPPVTINSLREAFLANVDSSLLAAQIQSFVITNPSQLPLAPVLSALFQAITVDHGTLPNVYLNRFLSATKYFSAAISHAGAIGPMAGVRALHMQIRKAAKWSPTSAAVPSSTSTSMSAELQRITLDRARRKEYILWARIHAGALDIGAFTFGYELQQQQQSSLSSHIQVPPDVFNESRVFSEIFAADTVWEEDEVEWVAGALVLQALIRSYLNHLRTLHVQHMRTDKRRKYEELLARYEERWKEMKDETRQAIVTEALLAAKADLARFGP